MKNNVSRSLLICLTVFLPVVTAGHCTCEQAGDSKKLALKYKLAAVAWILAAGAAGVCLPVMGKAMKPDKPFFSILKSFAAGVILSTGFVHVFPDAFESLTSPCIRGPPWGDFPLAGLVAMLASIGSLLVETYATSYYNRRETERGGDQEDGLMLIDRKHAHQPPESESELTGKTQLLRYRVISQVLEVGIVVHSVIVGIALGASSTPKTIRPLVAALSFHQLFEGIGLGGCIAQAKYDARSVVVMVSFFCLTTPMGIVVGIGMSNAYSDTSSTALIVQGVLNSASAGILVYMALVNLLSAEFSSPKLQSSSKLQLGAIVALLWGAGCMSFLAKWA